VRVGAAHLRCSRVRVFSIALQLVPPIDPIVLLFPCKTTDPNFPSRMILSTARKSEQTLPGNPDREGCTPAENRPIDNAGPGLPSSALCFNAVHRLEIASPCCIPKVKCPLSLENARTTPSQLFEK